jgi:hypothetical protein
MRSNKWKYEIGTRLNDDKRDITIINKEIRKKTYIKNNGAYNNQNQKWYEYHCNKCGCQGWSTEGNFNKGVGCGACCPSPKVIVLGINTIWDTDKWMIPIVGEEFAKTHTHSSSKKIYPTCSICGNKRNQLVTVNNIYNRKRIGCECENNISYPENITHALFNQLNLNFQTQLTKSTFEWCDKYKYDFYFNYNNEDYICEVNGLQHYERGFERIESTRKPRTLEEEQENDRIKKELALNNGIKAENYIVIDCRKSDLEWIRNNENGILKSRLNELFDLSKIDWNKCEEFALSSKIKEVCDIWNSNMFENCTDLANEIGMNRNVLREYLKKGNKLNLCNYSIEDAKEIAKDRRKKNIVKLVINLKDGQLFESIKNCADNYNIDSRRISDVCNNKIKQYKGFTFQFLNDLTPEEYIKYDIENKLKQLRKDAI